MTNTVLLLFAAAVSSLGAQDKPAPKQLVTSTTPITVTASVEAIDQTNRVVTLKTPKGDLIDTYVDESHKRFNELKVGDLVKASYYESLAVRVRAPGDPAPTSGATELATPRTGAPGETVARQLTMSVTIMAIDPSIPSITVKGPKGNVVSMRVQDPKRLAAVKVGDTVDVTYTQALLLSIESAK
jgi:hypothetical protein